MYVTGWTMSPDLPVRNAVFGFTGGEDENACEDFGCPDAFVAKLAPGGRSLIDATYLAGSRLDEATGIAVDPGGGVWIAGTAFSDDVPVTAGALQPARAGGDCPMADLWRFPNCSDGLLAAFGPGTTAPASTSLPVSAPPSVEAVPASTPAASATRPTRAARRLTVGRRERPVVGRLRGDARCVSRARVLLERRGRGPWRVVRRALTDTRGRFTVRLPAKRGRYRVRAPAVTRDGVMCGAARRSA